MADAVEFTMRVLPLNETLQQELAKLANEGWQPVPGLAAAVTYVMFRNVPQPVVTPEVTPAAAGMVQMNIDETKVQIYRNGRLVE